MVATYRDNTIFRKQLDKAIHSLQECRNNTDPIEVHYRDITLKLSLIGTTENILGENIAQYILTIHDQTDNHLVWENPLLTTREQQLVEILAKGSRVVDFQNHYKLAKSTAHMHWQHVKEKLNIKDRTEIQKLHINSQLPTAK